MTQIKSEVKTGKNFAVADLGLFSELRQFIFDTPEAPMKIEGKIFLKQILNLSSAEISLNNLPPDTSIPFYHEKRSWETPVLSCGEEQQKTTKVVSEIYRIDTESLYNNGLNSCTIDIS